MPELGLNATRAGMHPRQYFRTPQVRTQCILDGVRYVGKIGKSPVCHQPQGTTKKHGDNRSDSAASHWRQHTVFLVGVVHIVVGMQIRCPGVGTCSHQRNIGRRTYITRRIQQRLQTRQCIKPGHVTASLTTKEVCRTAVWCSTNTSKNTCNKGAGGAARTARSGRGASKARTGGVCAWHLCPTQEEQRRSPQTLLDNGCTASMASFLVLLRAKGETAAEVAGLAKAMHSKALRVNTPHDGMHAGGIMDHIKMY